MRIDLLERTLAGVPSLAARLHRGLAVAHVGPTIDDHDALTTLATRFPQGRYDGYEVKGRTARRAQACAAHAGLADRLRWRHHDVVAQGLPVPYDLVLVEGVCADAVEPQALLRAVRRGLRSGGACAIEEPRALLDAVLAAAAAARLVVVHAEHGADDVMLLLAT